MRINARPGRSVEAIAEVVLEDLCVIDVESGKAVSLAAILRELQGSGGDRNVGWVRITIEPWSRTSSLARARRRR